MRMRVHPVIWTAGVALIVIIGYDKLKGGALGGAAKKMRVGS